MFPPRSPVHQLRCFVAMASVTLITAVAEADEIPEQTQAPRVVKLEPVPSVASGHIERIQQFASAHILPRHIDVWLPDGYDGKTPHAVLYMHDGQMLFDANITWNKQEWRADEVAAQLQQQGKTRPFIIVGIPNGGELRHREYFPHKPWQSLSETEQRLALEPYQKEWADKYGSQGLYDVRSDSYLRFLVEDLKPHIDKNFAVLTDRDNTFVAGSSMGGLISLYAISEYPEVFGGAACMSTHWPGVAPFDNNPIPKAYFDYMAEHLPDPSTHKLYFDFGTATLDQHYPPLQAEADKVLAAKGFSEGNWMTRRFEGAEHSEQAWQARLHIPMTFLLGGVYKP